VQSENELASHVLEGVEKLPPQEPKANKRRETRSNPPELKLGNVRNPPKKKETICHHCKKRKAQMPI